MTSRWEPYNSQNLALNCSISADQLQTGSDFYIRGAAFTRGSHGFPQDQLRAFQMFLTGSEQYGHQMCTYNAAVCLFRGVNGVPKDEVKAQHLFELLVEQGFTSAMVNLGFLLTHGGEGITRDPSRAKELYERAINMGDIEASVNLGMLLETGHVGVERDAPAAKVLYERAAEVGSILALVCLGTLLRHGADGVEEDPVRAKDCFESASLQGHAGAMNALGELLIWGAPGIQKDPVAARRHFEAAVQREHPSAFHSLGLLLEKGYEGVPADPAAAKELFGQGAKLGSLACIQKFAVLLSEDENVGPMEWLGAFCLLVESSQRVSLGDSEDDFRTVQGEGGSRFDNNFAGGFVLANPRPGGMDAETLFILGSMSRAGCGGVGKNPVLAKDFYERAVRKGHVKAMLNLGNLLLHGDDGGVLKDPPAAKHLFERAVESGNSRAMTNLGNLLLRGETGVRRNLSLGVLHLERAVLLDGHPFAKTTLAQVLLSEGFEERNPVRALSLLKSAAHESSFGLAFHELGVLYERGDNGVPPDPEKSAQFFARAVGKELSAGVTVSPESQRLLAAGEEYVTEIEKYLQYSTSRPRACLLLTVGSTARGKTSTVNSLRGMPFVEEHIPTQTAAMSKCVIEPGKRVVEAEIISEFDFNENSLIANVSRTGFLPSELRPCSKQRIARIKSHNGDVIERVRRGIAQNPYPQGFQSNVLRCWDLAGQSEYEMVNSLFIARGDVLVFVTNLRAIFNVETRSSEVSTLCYWMQLAHAVVPDPSLTRAVIVGTHKGSCGDETLQLLHELLQSRLGSAVYDSWVRTREAEEGEDSPPYGNLVAIENSIAEEDPDESGIIQLERVVKNAADAIVSQRGQIPLRWLALIDKLERDKRMCLSKADLEEICDFFPGFHCKRSDRSEEVLEALRCLASMGRLILFELSSSEYYVFTDTDAIIKLTGKIIAPEQVLRRRLSHADIIELGKGRISRDCLFGLWDECGEQEKDVILKLLFEYDVLMLLESYERIVIAIPSLLPSGWEDFTWCRSAGEKDITVTTQFRDVVPNGFIGRVIAHLHRKMGFNSLEPGLLKSFKELLRPSSRPTEKLDGPVVRMVRANAVLLSVSDGSRVFVGFKVAERKLHWKFRGKQPLRLVWTCIRQVERLLETRMNIIRKHIITKDCQCGERNGLEVRLPQNWLFESEYTLLPSKTIICKECQCPCASEEIIDSHLQATPTLTPSPYPEPVTTPIVYKAFLSHAGPDKLTIARPIFEALEGHDIPTFLDCECLLMDSSTAPELMHRAMRQADIAIFILSPEFAARKWTLIELRHFLERNQTSASENRPVVLPIFYRLTIGDCHNVYNESGSHAQLLHETGFFSPERQSVCSTAQAVEVMSKITTFSGVERRRLGGGAPLSSAEIAIETVQRVLRFLEGRRA